MISLPGLKSLHGVWKRFSGKHGDLKAFGKSLYPDALQEGTLLALYAKTPDGQTHEYYLELDAEDVKMAHEIERVVKKR